MKERPPILRKTDSSDPLDLTPLFASMTALIFAVELYASITSYHWDWAFWAHIVIVGALESFLIGYLLIRVWGMIFARWRGAGLPLGGRR